MGKLIRDREDVLSTAGPGKAADVIQLHICPDNGCNASGGFRVRETQNCTGNKNLYLNVDDHSYKKIIATEKYNADEGCWEAEYFRKAPASKTFHICNCDICPDKRAVAENYQCTGEYTRYVYFAGTTYEKVPGTEKYVFFPDAPWPESNGKCWEAEFSAADYHH